MNPIVALFAVLCGFAGYKEAKRSAKRYGRTPFGLSALVWGIICFLSLLIGFLLLAIAERVRRRETPGLAQHYTTSR